MPSPRLPLSLCLAAALSLTPAPFAGEASVPKPVVRFYLAGAGVLLLAGGGAFAYCQNREADRDMKVYRGSAFTVNTEEYRGKVEEHERFTWAGLAGAALGAVLVVASF